MSKKTTWADVRRGQTVELGGREWLVTKIKVDGKSAKVRVEHKGREAKSVVRVKDRVTIVAAPKPGKDRSRRAPLTGPEGEQTRWATDKELRKALDRGLAKGDPEQKEPPTPASGDPWESQSDRIEKMLGRVLEARLVAETKDEAAGYYVPPVDSSTVAAHLALMHGGIPEACDDDEARMLKAHDAQHAAALKGEGVLEKNHWHTERRP